MAVRRVAPPEVQPKAFAFTAENLAWARSSFVTFSVAFATLGVVRREVTR